MERSIRQRQTSPAREGFLERLNVNNYNLEDNQNTRYSVGTLATLLSLIDSGSSKRICRVQLNTVIIPFDSGTSIHVTELRQQPLNSTACSPFKISGFINSSNFGTIVELYDDLLLKFPTVTNKKFEIGIPKVNYFPEMPNRIISYLTFCDDQNCFPTVSSTD